MTKRIRNVKVYIGTNEEFEAFMVEMLKKYPKKKDVKT